MIENDDTIILNNNKSNQVFVLLFINSLEHFFDISTTIIEINSPMKEYSNPSF